MWLRFTFLLITRVASWLRLSQREETRKTAEILILRHQLAVLQRRQPRRPNLNWADRAPPRDVAAGCLRHDPALAPRPRPPPLGGAIPARQDRPAGDTPERQGTGPPASPGEPRMGLPQDPRRAGRPGSEGSGVDGTGNSEECRDRPGAAADRADLVAVPALPGRSDPGMRLLHGRPARRHPGPTSWP